MRFLIHQIDEIIIPTNSTILPDLLDTIYQQTVELVSGLFLNLPTTPDTQNL